MASEINFKSVKLIESHLLDVMETDEHLPEWKTKELEEEYRMFPDQLNTARLGILYHERAMRARRTPGAEKSDFASRSFELLDELQRCPDTYTELRPFVAAYRSSTMALLAVEKRKPLLLSESFSSFEKAISQYSPVSYCPEFLRANTASNLPWFLFQKRKLARTDYESIIKKYRANSQYAPYRVMSLVYFGWAAISQSGRYVQQAISYLDNAIRLDPRNRAAARKATELKERLTKQ